MRLKLFICFCFSIIAFAGCRKPVGSNNPAWSLHYSVDGQSFSCSGQKLRQTGVFVEFARGLAVAGFDSYQNKDGVTLAEFEMLLNADTYFAYWPIRSLSFFCHSDTSFFEEDKHYLPVLESVPYGQSNLTLCDGFRLKSKEELSYLATTSGWCSFHLGDGNDILYYVEFDIDYVNSHDALDTLNLSGILTMRKTYYVQVYDDWLGHSTAGSMPDILIKEADNERNHSFAP